jgi:hypothetical protein
MSIQMGDNKNPVAAAAATVVAVDIGSGAPMDVAAFTNLANGNRPVIILYLLELFEPQTTSPCWICFSDL